MQSCEFIRSTKAFVKGTNYGFKSTWRSNYFLYLGLSFLSFLLRNGIYIQNKYGVTYLPKEKLCGVTWVKHFTFTTSSIRILLELTIDSFFMPIPKQGGMRNTFFGEFFAMSRNTKLYPSSMRNSHAYIGLHIILKMTLMVMTV